MIFAWGDNDPAADGDITYHGFANRGTAGVLLISSPPNEENELPKNLQKLQFTFESVVLPRVDTYYYNEVYKLPNMPSKMHIVKVRLST